MAEIAESHCFALVLHDVAPATWPIYEEFVAAVDAVGNIPMTLLVVPDFHGMGRLDGDPAFVEAMERRITRGDELALHGYYHADPGPIPASLPEFFMRRLYTREGEFYRLPENAARERIEQGLALFRGLGWPVEGFVPPAWLLGPQARIALQESPFGYTSDRTRLIRLPSFEAIEAPSLVWSARSAWRRGLSSIYNRQYLARHRKAELLRLGVHPVDVRYPEVARFWLRTVAGLMTERRAVTKRQWLARQR